MSGSSPLAASEGSSPESPVFVPTQALWTWSNPVSGQQQIVQSYPTVNGAPTKSGVLRADLEAYIQMTIQQYSVPQVPISDNTVTQWIRWAEDDIESETNVRLCQTWLAAPPAKTNTEVQLLDLGVKYNYQQLGIDYDVAEPAYDFFF